MARSRTRGRAFSFDKDDIGDRIKRFYTDDKDAHDDDFEMRLQRYAKYRQWIEVKDEPWPDSSNVAVPDMMTSSLRMQDTLHNAVMVQRPAVVSKSISKANAEKQDDIDNLIDYQIFEEAKGEEMVAELAENFTNDGVFFAFIPWIKEDRKHQEVRTFKPIPEEQSPEEYFSEILAENFRGITAVNTDKEGWDWLLQDDEKSFKVQFYTDKDDKVEMVSEQIRRVFDGPKPIVKDYEDVLYPRRSANLQRPSPSNPGGASHVILVDTPTWDEVLRLKQSGFYDLLTDEDVEEISGLSQNRDHDEQKEQKDAMEGVDSYGGETIDDLHKPLTRLMVFDVYDIDGDGVGEDVIWWYILEIKKVVKAKPLTEMYPSSPARRPLASAQFLPVKGRVAGISMLEMMEGLHDWMKEVIDQTMDTGTLTNSPFFFYRAHGAMKPGTIRLYPGEGYPLGDPKRDVVFPNMNNQSQAFGINMISLIQQFTERLSVIGDLQLGRVPQGKASALRTVGGMQTVLGQGEARPERILRRYFMGLTEIWSQAHELNQFFLPKDKEFRIIGPKDAAQEIYKDIKERSQISGRFQFRFNASVLNTNKGAVQDSLLNMMGSFISEFTVQAGIMQPDGAYRLLRDYGRSLDQDADKYLTKPNPDVNKMRIQAEDAIHSILTDQLPDGIPEEPAQEHLEKLLQFQESDDFGLLTEEQIPMFTIYLNDVMQRVQIEAQQAALAQAAGAAGGGAPQAQLAPPVDQSNPAVQGEELLQEDLPGAGGGANP